MPIAFAHRLILLVCAIGLAPVAFSYGAAPAVTVPQLFGFSADAIDAAHIFRALMGLYLGMVALWLLGFFRPRFTAAALLSQVAFMWGLAGGRLLSWLLDGTPSALLICYFALEAGTGAIGLWSYFKAARPHPNPSPASGRGA